MSSITANSPALWTSSSTLANETRAWVRRSRKREEWNDIGKRLYMNFGIISRWLWCCSLVNLVAVAARACGQGCSRRLTAINRRHQRGTLSDDAEPALSEQLLLSGDTREVDRMNDGMRALNSKLEEGKTLANSEQERPRSRKSATGTDVGQEFAQPLIDKRKDVDSGNATVAECQIFLSAKDAGSWVKNSRKLLTWQTLRTESW